MGTNADKLLWSEVAKARCTKKSEFIGKTVTVIFRATLGDEEYIGTVLAIIIRGDELVIHLSGQVELRLTPKREIIRIYLVDFPVVNRFYCTD